MLRKRMRDDARRRLRMRPHAPEAILVVAGESTKSMVEAITIVRSALVAMQVSRATHEPPGPNRLTEIADLIERGYDAMLQYVKQARPAIAALLGE